jgi:hypothetical protein
MAELARALNKHAAKVAEVYQGSVHYDDEDYTVAVGISPCTLELESGGSRPGEKLTTRIPKSLLATEPKAREVVKHAGGVYVIESVQGREAWAKEWVIVAVR